MTSAPPPADRDDTVETLHGIDVPDPYRYLEDPDGQRTAAFVAAQNAVSGPFLAALPGRGAFGAAVRDLLTRPRAGVPGEHGGRYFRTVNPGQLDQDQLVSADTLAGLLAGGDIVLDPNQWSSDGAAALTGLGITSDGRRVAYARSDGGSDWRTIRVVELAPAQDRASGPTDPGDTDGPADGATAGEDGATAGAAAQWRELPDLLEHTKWVAPTWLPDRESLLYWRYPAPATDDDPAALGPGALVRHRLGTPQAQDEVVWQRPESRDWMVDPFVSDDGRWLILTAAPGTDSRSTITARRLRTDEDGTTEIDPGEVVVVGELADAHTVIGVEDDLLLLRTERDAPTGALVTVDLNAPREPWRRLLTGDEDRVLVDAALAADALCVVFSVDAAHRVELVDRSGAPLPGPDWPRGVSVAGLNTHPGSAEIFVGITSFTSPLTVFRLEGGASEILPGTAEVGPPVSVIRRRAASSDRVSVPMSVIRRADRPVDGPAPTLIYGYGGFDIPVLPTFSALFTAWVAAGGVLVVANLRGGGEFGQPWHTAGMRSRKQQVFDDLYACAELLIDVGVTSADRLAVHGRSNGGLLVGAAMTQRPDLWAACLPTVGVLDMLRFHRFTIGWAWTTEYGTPDDADDFATLHAYSPLHRLEPGRVYPPTLICTGDHDDRVVPAHSLKFGAQLQHGQARVRRAGPALLRIDTRAGHGVGKPVHALAAEYADQLAFAAHFTSLVPS